MSRARRLLERMIDEKLGIRAKKNRIRELYDKGDGSMPIRAMGEVCMERIDMMLDENCMDAPNPRDALSGEKLKEARKMMKNATKRLREVQDAKEEFEMPDKEEAKPDKK